VELANGDIIVASNAANEHFRTYNLTHGRLTNSWSQDNYPVHFMCVLENNKIAVGNRARNAEIRIYNPINGTLLERVSQDGYIHTVEDLFDKSLQRQGLN